MRTFTLYRRAMPEHGVANPINQAQLEGCEFSDGAVAVRWLTEHRSMVFWPSLADFEAVHVAAHPEYRTEIVWDGAPAAVTGVVTPPVDTPAGDRLAGNEQANVEGVMKPRGY